MWVPFDCPMARYCLRVSNIKFHGRLCSPLRSFLHDKFGRRGKVFCFDKCKRIEPRMELGKLGCGPSRSVPGLPGSKVDGGLCCNRAFRHEETVGVQNLTGQVGSQFVTNRKSLLALPR